MNGQKLYEDFEKRYGKEQEQIYVFQAASPLPLFGAELARFQEPGIGIGIAPPSMAAVRRRTDGLFRIQTVYSNEEAFCRRENLGVYQGNKLYKEIFALIARMGKTLGGADFLFYEREECELFCHAAAVCALVLQTLSEKERMPGELLQNVLWNDADEERNVRELISLCAKKNQAVLIRDVNPSTLPFPAEHEKIILISAEMKRKPNLDCIHSIEELAEAAEHNRYAKYLLREIERTNAAVHALERGKDALFRTLLECSTKDFLDMAGREAKHLRILYQIAEPISCGCKVVEGAGLFCFVPNAETDTFLDRVHSAYQKKAGTSPAFYIGEMTESGEVSDIKTE